MLEPLLPGAGLAWEIIRKEDQVLITLRYLATNCHQTVIADCFDVCQKVVSDVVTRVVDVLNHPTIKGPLPPLLAVGRALMLAKMLLDASTAASSESDALSTLATTTTAERHVAQSI
ncbi:unnamed protein product [Cylicocyclus nassatus]|uniref:Uncharacterized protein n=1 Tax=Cylicocyclus nassatus TaxID=53992 RepID=A0AA36DPG8_CYLNA|nr:unnamed protein product [Cylicocyclus nassatus]